MNYLDIKLVLVVSNALNRLSLYCTSLSGVLIEWARKRLEARK